MNLRLLSYWEKIRRGRPMPAPEDIRPEDIPDLWDSCFIIGVAELGNATGQQYLYLGQGIIKAHAEVIRGDAGPMISPHPGRTEPHFSRVIQSRKPLLEEGEFLNNDHEIVRYRQCLMPLGRGDRIEAIFGGMHFKIFSVDNVSPVLRKLVIDLPAPLQ